MGNVVKMEGKCSKCGKRPSECDSHPKGPRTFLCPWRPLKLAPAHARHEAP
jgi:hypothetical protein